MISDISFMYSDNIVPLDEDEDFDPRIALYVERDIVATRYNDSPENVENYDPISYIFGVICDSAENMATKRKIARQKAELNF